MKKNTANRLFTLFLAALMALSSLPLAFAQDAPEVTDKSDYNIESTNSLGKILNEAVEEYQASPDENYYISDISFSGNTAAVQLHNQDVCDIVIAAYDETDMRMLSSDAKTIEANTSSVELTLADLSAENMIVKAFLLDADHNPLSRPFTFNGFSKEYKEFMSYTVNDFDEEKVVNLDDSEENNFFVLNDEVNTVSQSGTKNVLVIADFDNEMYTFSNADKNLTGLKKGDIFYYDQGNVEELIITRVVKVTAGKDGSVVIEGQPLDLEEAFTCVKIEDTLDNGDFYQVEEANTLEGEEKRNAVRNAPVDVGGDLDPIQFAFEYPKDKDKDKDEDKEGWSFSGKVRVGFIMNISAHIKLYWSAFYKEVEVKVNPEIDFEFSAEGAAHFKKNLPEIKARTIAGVNLGFSPAFEFDISGEISVKIPGIGFTLGFRWDSKEFKNLCSWETPKWDELKIKVKVFVGIDLNPNVDFINKKVATAGVVGPIGLELSGTLSLFHADDRVKHDCKICVDGSLDFKILNLSFEVVLFEGKKGWIIKEKKKSLPIADISIHILDFYWSQTHGEVGFGECPHKFVKVDFLVKDADSGTAVADAEINSGVTNALAIKYNGDSATVKTDKDGKATYYYPLGTYKATVTAADYTQKETDEIRVEYVQPSDQYYVNDSSSQVTLSCEISVEKIIASGSCGESGDNVTWTLDDKGTLTISGSGAMCNYGGKSSPWYQIASVKNVILQNGVTSIGDFAFVGCTGLTSVTIPDSVTSIGNYAFFDCTGLTSVTIPDSVTNIGEFAFSHCTGLTAVTIPDSVTSIGGSAFRYCTGLISVTIPDSVTSIGNYAFYDCRGLTSVTIPDSVTSIGNYAFSGCTRLTSVTIPDSVMSIGYGVFSGCTGLTSVTIPDSVTSIGHEAFYRCDSLVHTYYTGTEAQWQKISIGSDNNSLKRYITYNHVPTANARNTSSVMVPLAERVSAKRNAASGATVLDRANVVKGEEYLLLVVKDANAENLLAADNLLYIDQQTAESETLTFSYIPREIVAGAVATIYGPDKDSHVHKHTATVTKEPTCTEPGETTFTCPCGDSYTETIPAAGHTLTKTEAKAPTCVEPGNAAYYTCSVCGKTFGDENGETELTETAVPATGEHTYGEWTVTKEATVDAEGEEVRTCSVCGEKETRAIPKAEPAAPEFTPGDVNNDGKIGSDDARLALRTSVKLEKDITDGTAAYKAADYNGDGVVKSDDARAILRVSVKLDPFG